jgi:hypothetical protein
LGLTSVRRTEMFIVTSLPVWIAMTFQRHSVLKL